MNVCHINQMNVAYKQWFFIKKNLFPYIQTLLELDDEKKRYEARNVIHHWLMFVNQDNKIKKYEYYPLLPRIQKTDESALILRNAIFKKEFFDELNERRSHFAMEDILLYIETSHNQYQVEDLNLHPNIINGVVHISEFHGKKFPNLEYMLSNVGSNTWSETDIVMMMLKYESLGNNSYQWSDPRELHDCYYDNYNVRYEGFASPFNSSFLDREDCKFCSLFPDTDSVFGSMGDFFKVNLANYPGGWSVNPPFVEDILKRVSEHVIEALDAGVQSTYFCSFPKWPDCTGWKNLHNSSYNVRTIDRQQNIVLINAYGEYFSPPMSMSIFCLSYNRNIDLEKVDSIISKTFNDFNISENIPYERNL